MIDSPRMRIQAQSIYIQAQSAPERARFVFAYTITIHNLGRHPMQLLNRYWLITNGDGHKTETRGEGVIGQQPIIQPHAQYQYTSGVVLETPMGTMQGFYEMSDASGQVFRIDIPVFRLAIQSLIH